jgi:hypothetical protein
VTEIATPTSSPNGGKLEGKLVYLKWYDAATHKGDAWREKVDLDALKLPVCETVGWVYRQDAQGVIVVATKDALEDEPEKTYHGEFAISHGMIIECRELKKSRKRSTKRLK